MEAYLLWDGGILLDPDLVYVDPEGFKTGFCVYQGEKRTLTVSFLYLSSIL